MSAKRLEIVTEHHKVALVKKQKTPCGESLVSAKGLEPLTNGLKGHCSTIELRADSESDFIIPRM